MFACYLRCDTRNQYLPAMPRRHNARRKVERLTEVIIVTQLGFPGVESYAGEQQDLRVLQELGGLSKRALRVDRRIDRVNRRHENSMDSIAGGFDNISVIGFDGFLQNR